VRALLDEWGEADEFDLVAARAQMDAWQVPAGELPGGVAISASEIAGVPVRIYEPDHRGRTKPPHAGESTPANAERAPTVVWCHGGGFVLGTAAVSDPLGCLFASRLGWPVVSVDYRLAPEHPFPAAFDDTLAVLRAALRQGPVVIGGDSAGGSLAAAACLTARDEGLDVAAQVLLNPFLDLTLSNPSIDEFARGYGLTRQALREFVRLYLADADPEDRRCSPLLAPSFGRLPPAVIVTAEFDPLRDEAEAYAARLDDAGVVVRARRWDGMVHGFFGMFEVTPAASEALDWTVAALAEVVGS